MAALSSLVLGGLAAGGIAGAVSGAEGTPDQVQNFNQTQTTDMGTTQQATATKTFDKASAQERALQQQSLQNYLQQQALAGQYEEGIGSAQTLQEAARQQQLGVLGGGALQATPQEMAAIQAQRQAIVAGSQADVNRLLDERLGQVQRSAAERGVRGQALSQLQGEAARGAAEQLGQAQRQADIMAAQQTLEAPYRRVAAQQAAGSQALSLSDQMRLQAQQNRIAAQNPFLLQSMQQERLAGGTTKTSGSTQQKGTVTTQGQQITPGEEGSFGKALVGGLTGGLGGATAGANIATGVGALGGLGGGGGSASSLRPGASSTTAGQPYVPQGMRIG